MDFFKGLVSQQYSTPNQKGGSPLKTTIGTSFTPQRKGKKIKLTCTQQQKNQKDLDQMLVIKALNNSFTQRMSGNYAELEQNDILKLVVDFAFNDFANYGKQDISIRKWCVVEIDENNFKQKIISDNICTCSYTTNQERNQYNVFNHIDLPSTIRPYCLVLNMADKQLHFQSHQSARSHFFINLDTVSVSLQQENFIRAEQLLNQKNEIVQQILNRPLVLKVLDVNKPLQINIYITSFTLPFPFKQTAKQRQKLSYLLNVRQSLYLTLNKAINQSRGNELKLRRNLNTAVSSSILYYNTRYATQQQFTKYCQSGDVVLFRDNHTFAKLQRAVTSSPYDHVAIVFRSEQYGICLFQSNSSLGVGLASWRKLIRCRWFEGIQKIAWRKLQVHNKPKDFDQKVNQFVKGNLHKQFGISLPKLLKFKSVTYSKDSHKQYFCSELAAELYRYLGLLDEKKSGTQYWPKDFADGNGIKILNGSLDMEREIIFQDSILKKCYPDFK